MPIAVAMGIGLRVSAIVREFDFDVALFVTQGDEAEAVEIETVGNLQAEGLFLERDGPIKAEDSDHHV